MGRKALDRAGLEANPLPGIAKVHHEAAAEGEGTVRQAGEEPTDGVVVALGEAGEVERESAFPDLRAPQMPDREGAQGDGFEVDRGDRAHPCEGPGRI